MQVNKFTVLIQGSLTANEDPGAAQTCVLFPAAADLYICYFKINYNYTRF